MSDGLPYDVPAISAFAQALTTASKKLGIAISQCTKQQPDAIEFEGRAANQYGAALTAQINRLKSIQIDLDRDAITFRAAVPIAMEANKEYLAAQARRRLALDAWNKSVFE